MVFEPFEREYISPNDYIFEMLEVTFESEQTFEVPSYVSDIHDVLIVHKGTTVLDEAIGWELKDIPPYVGAGDGANLNVTVANRSIINMYSSNETSTANVWVFIMGEL